MPPDLETLIFVEGTKVLKLFDALILDKQDLVCMLKTGGIEVYNGKRGKYIVSYTPKDLTTGEVIVNYMCVNLIITKITCYVIPTNNKYFQIIQELVEWINKASKIYAVTSESVATYQSLEMLEKPETLIRKLSTETNSFGNYTKLESPNLISGLGADVLSFCIQLGLRSTLFVVYRDCSPFDSINTNPIIQLMKVLGLNVKLNLKNLNPITTNMYL